MPYLSIKKHLAPCQSLNKYLLLKYFCQGSGNGNDMCQIKEWSCDNGIGDDWSKFEFEMTYMVNDWFLCVKEPFDWLEKPMVKKVVVSGGREMLLLELSQIG